MSYSLRPVYRVCSSRFLSLALLVARLACFHNFEIVARANAIPLLRRRGPSRRRCSLSEPRKLY
eukprot:6211786-Pleurochrysis_carterae.AAC.1